MNVYFANCSQQKIGGGWSFLDNIQKGLTTSHSTDDYSKSDIYFIAGATMAQRDEVIKAKTDGKKVVLRIDNAVRNSRNRNTGMSRMKEFAELADLVVYQSEWAQGYLAPFTGITGTVILNSVDETIFNTAGREYDSNSFIYSRYNRDETKNWEMARYAFSRNYATNAKLTIVGNFSPELREYNFDFYNNENYEYVGVVADPKAMAKLYRRNEYLLFTYFNDACSNTLIEALCCGMEIYDPYGMGETGGSSEIYKRFANDGREYFGLERMTNEYKEAIGELL